MKVNRIYPGPGYTITENDGIIVLGWYATKEQAELALAKINQSGQSVGEFVLIIFAVIAASAIAWTFAGYPATLLLGTLAELLR
jgi:hypothetical protein